MGATKGRCAAVIAAGLLMASCIHSPACGRRVEMTMASHFNWSVQARGIRTTPIDVYRDHLPPDVVFRQTSWDPSSEEFRATFPDGSWLRIDAGSCLYDGGELELCVEFVWPERDRG